MNHIFGWLRPARWTVARRRQFARQGMVLIVVLVAIALLSLASYTFTELMFSERQAAGIQIRSLQARSLVDSGMNLMQVELGQLDQTLLDQGGLYDNPDHYRGVVVLDADDARDRGCFTIVSPRITEGQVAGIRYGLEDESGRLNLNTLLWVDKQVPGAGRGLLMALPGMTEDIADAILDWMDTDDDQREFGAESETYSGLTPPYAPKNGPLETVEELLLVRGVTPQLLFGLDTNRNSVVDATESSGNLGDVDNSDGSLNGGWAPYLTLYSSELNLKPDGTLKLDLNGDDMQKLYDDLQKVVSKDMATFVVAYRQGKAAPAASTGSSSGGSSGGKSGSTSDSGKADSISGHELDMSKPGTRKLTTVLDLVDAKVQLQFKGDQKETVVQSPLNSAALAVNTDMQAIMDNTAVNKSPVIPGRVNVNQACKSVLLGIPGMTEQIVDQIVSEREPDTTTAPVTRKHETWLLAEGIVTLAQMKQIMPFVTGSGNVYRGQVVGYFPGGGPTARVEVVIDATTSPPRLVFWRDLTHLGRGYPLATLGVQAQQ